MNFKIFFLIFVLAFATVKATPLPGYTAMLSKPVTSCFTVGHCIYEHAECSTKIIIRNVGCNNRRKCCVTNFL